MLLSWSFVCVRADRLIEHTKAFYSHLRSPGGFRDSVATFYCTFIIHIQYDSYTYHILSKLFPLGSPNGSRVAVHNGHSCTTLGLFKSEHCTLAQEHAAMPAAMPTLDCDELESLKGGRLECTVLEQKVTVERKT